MVKSGLRFENLNILDSSVREHRISSDDECDPNEEARQMAISMVPKITSRVIRLANKNERASGRFYELPPPNAELIE